MQTATKLIHGLPVDPLTGAVSVPIYQTATFVQEGPGVNKGFDYSRSNNPTRQALEEHIAALENGKRGLAFASGLAAIDAVVKLLSTGDEILAVDDLYGGAYRLFTQVYSRLGIETRFVDTSDPVEVAASISEKTRILWLESPTNPTLKISDIRVLAAICKKAGILLVVDNTFASPISQQPIDLGADIVVHSATKYLAGHSDVIAGLLVTATEELGARLKFIQNASGAVLGPQDSWLTLRGIQTLDLRFKQQSRNALAIARALEDDPRIEVVHYPGLKSHPGHEIAREQQTIYGGVLSFRFREDLEENAIRFVKATKLFKLAESLGGTRSLCCHPATMTHKSTPAEIRRNAGVADSLVRLSCGLEDTADLLNDVFHALNCATEKKEAVFNL